MTAYTTVEELAQVIEALVELGLHFQDILITEQHTLSHWPMDTLPESTRAKLSCARELEQLEERRQTLITSLLGPSMTGSANELMAKAILQHVDAANLLTRWQQALTVLRQCHELNRVNGLTIQIQSRQTQHSLEILGTHIGLPMIYDRNGQSGPGRLRKHLAQA